MMVLASIVTSAVWYMSPLALGFAIQSTDPQKAEWGIILYKASYFIGIPVLLVTQPVALFLAHNGRRRAALLISLVSASAFAICAGLVLYLLG